MCSNCKYLKITDKKEGLSSGELYYCTIKNQHVYASDKCNNHETDYKRNKQIIEEINESSKNFDDISFSPEALFMILVLLIVIGFLSNAF